MICASDINYCDNYFQRSYPCVLKPRKKEKKRLKQWKEEDKTGKQVTIPYFRDFEKANRIVTEDDIEDMQLQEWPEHRRKNSEETKLPLGMRGSKFIKITMGFPLGWRDREKPLTLAEARKVAEAEAEERKIKEVLENSIEKTEKGTKKKKGSKKKKGKGSSKKSEDVEKENKEK